MVVLDCWMVVITQSRLMAILVKLFGRTLKFATAENCWMSSDSCFMTLIVEI